MTRASLGIDRAAWKRELARAFQPILGGTLLPVGAYYAVVVVLHYLTEPPVNFAILGSIAALTSLSAFLVYRRLRGRKAGYVELELLALLIYGLVFANILVHHLLHLEVHKLVYFLFLTLIIAVTGISLRLIVPAVLTTLATSWSRSSASTRARSG